MAIKDKFDLIYSQNGKTFVVKWLFNHKLKYEDTYIVDFSVMNLAYKNKFPNKIQSTKFGYFDLLNQKPEFTEFKIEQEDLDALKYWCSSLSEENVFPSRRGLTAYCKSCPYDKPCSKWVAWSKKEEKNDKK